MITKQEMLEHWAGELIRVKALLLQVSQLLQMGVVLTRTQQNELDRLIERREQLKKLIEELKKSSD